MAGAIKQVDFRIMGREFRVSLPESEERQLLDAVSYVERKMIDMRDKSKVIGIERIAIMTALAIASDFLHGKEPDGVDLEEYRRRIHSMQSAIDAAMVEQEKLF